MPKWIKQMGVAATVGAGLMSWAGAAQATTAAAPPPPISLGAARTAATPTTVSGAATPEAILGLTQTRVAYVAADDNAAELVWLQNSAGAFPSNATGQLSKAPVPVHADQIINRSGKLIRIFIQDDGKDHGGRRLLEQVQS